MGLRRLFKIFNIEKKNKNKNKKLCKSCTDANTRVVLYSIYFYLFIFILFFAVYCYFITEKEMLCRFNLE